MPVDASSALLRWYAVDKRSLPWRAERGAGPDPYAVWLSEVMLQQTTVAAVRPRFETFLRRWPDVNALAAADEGDVMAAWAGLGYYARARNLIACARKIAGELGGVFPSTEAELAQLPGIGRYTAAAIAAIAFGRRAVVMDANIERVTARLFAVETPLPAARPQLYALVDRLTPAEGAGDFAQAMMDLGSGICTPRAPACQRCPLATYCAARAAGTMERYPVRRAKPARPHRMGIAYWLERNGEVLLVRRPAKGLLGGMIGLPSIGWEGDAVAPAGRSWTDAGAVEHGFTHFTLRLDIKCGQALRSGPGDIWWPIDRIDEAGLPTLFRKAAARALAWREQQQLPFGAAA